MRTEDIGRSYMRLRKKAVYWKKCPHRHFGRDANFGGIKNGYPVCFLFSYIFLCVFEGCRIKINNRLFAVENRISVI